MEFLHRGKRGNREISNMIQQTKPIQGILFCHKNRNHVFNPSNPQIGTFRMILATQQASHASVTPGSMKTKLTCTFIMVIKVESLVLNSSCILLLGLIIHYNNIFVYLFTLLKVTFHFISNNRHRIINTLSNPNAPL